MKINIHIDHQDNFTFGLMIAAIFVIWFAFALFSRNTQQCPGAEEWFESQPARPSSGMEW